MESYGQIIGRRNIIVFLLDGIVMFLIDICKASVYTEESN